MAKPERFRADTSRFIYEPRAYWEVAAIESDVVGASGQLGRVVLDEQNFRNVSRYKIVLTHMLLSPIGYTVRSFNASGEPESLTTYDAAASIINKMRVAISAPFSAHFNAWDMGVPGFTPVPTAEPAMASSADPNVTPEAGGLVYSSGLFGLSRWAFDQPYELASKAACRLDLSSYPISNGMANPPVYAPSSSVLFGELTGAMGGHARLRDRAASVHATAGLIYPKGPTPTPFDAFGINTLAGSDPGVWPASQLFKPAEYRKQENNRGGVPTQMVTGFSIAIDQIAYDDAYALAGEPASGYPMAPMSQRMVCRGRTETGGTQEWWWREGAPIALVCPTMTPALVKRIESPIILDAGEGLQIELQAPPPQSFGGETGTLAPIYNVGISFCGFAILEK